MGISRCAECKHKIGSQELFNAEIWVCELEALKENQVELKPCFKLNKYGDCSQFEKE